MLQLIKLEFKSFFRSSALGGKLATKIFMWIGYIYIIFMTIALAFIHGSGGAAFIKQEGDVENPQGGVRSVIPSKQHYKRKL